MPCTTRAATSNSSVSAAPQNTDATVNPAMAQTNTRLRPKRADSQPAAEIAMADDTMYDVMTQPIWSWVAENAPCMCGSATAAMVQSME